MSSNKKTKFDIETVEAWADITQKIWLQHQKALGFSEEDGHLMDATSRNYELTQSGGDRYNIKFINYLYGIFVDMGVGREFSRGGSGNISNDKGYDYQVKREPKEWFARNYYAQTKRLKEIVIDRYTHLAVSKFIDSFSDVFTNASTGKGMMYNVKQSMRNKRNYDKRRALPGRWVGDRSRRWKPDPQGTVKYGRS